MILKFSIILFTLADIEANEGNFSRALEFADLAQNQMSVAALSTANHCVAWITKMNIYIKMRDKKAAKTCLKNMEKYAKQTPVGFRKEYKMHIKQFKKLLANMPQKEGPKTRVRRPLEKCAYVHCNKVEIIYHEIIKFYCKILDLLQIIIVIFVIY